MDRRESLWTFALGMIGLRRRDMGIRDVQVLKVDVPAHIKCWKYPHGVVFPEQVVRDFILTTKDTGFPPARYDAEGKNCGVIQELSIVNGWLVARVQLQPAACRAIDSGKNVFRPSIFQDDDSSTASGVVTVTKIRGMDEIFLTERQGACWENEV